jgi:hypothetical protein
MFSVTIDRTKGKLSTKSAVHVKDDDDTQPNSIGSADQLTIKGFESKNERQHTIKGLEEQLELFEKKIEDKIAETSGFLQSVATTKEKRQQPSSAKATTRSAWLSNAPPSSSVYKSSGEGLRNSIVIT